MFIVSSYGFKGTGNRLSNQQQAPKQTADGLELFEANEMPVLSNGPCGGCRWDSDPAHVMTAASGHPRSEATPVWRTTLKNRDREGQDAETPFQKGALSAGQKDFRHRPHLVQEAPQDSVY